MDRPAHATHSPANRQVLREERARRRPVPWFWLAGALLLAAAAYAGDDTSGVRLLSFAGLALGAVAYVAVVRAGREAGSADGDASERISELSTRLDRVEEAMKLSGVGHWELDLVGDRLYWSEQIYRIFEVDPAQFGASYEAFLAMVHPDDRERVDQAYRDSLAQRSPYEVVHRLLTPDGREKHLLERGATFYDAAGGPIRSIGSVQDITRLVESEQALRRSEATLEEAQRIAQLGSWNLDIASGTAQWSSQEYRCLGYEPGACAPAYDNFLAAVHPDDRDKVRAAVSDALAGRRPYDLTHRVVWPDGEVRFVHELAVVTRDAEDRPTRMLGTTLDVTERHEAVQRLRVMDYAIASSINAVAMSDAQGRLTYVNPAFLRLWGYASADEVVGRLAVEFWEDAEAPAAVIRELTEHGEWVGELVGKRKDGSLFDAELSASLVLDDDGMPVCMMGFFVDVTARKRAETRLRQAASVFASTHDGVVITDSRGTILDVNDAFTEITGYSRAEAIGANPRLRKSDRHDAAFYAAFWKSLRENGSWQGEIWNRRKNGDVYPEWLTVNAVRDETGAIVSYVAVFSDISGIKRSQAQLAHQAQHDPLTGLPNRLLFRDRLEHALSRAERTGAPLAVLFLDLDRFKHVNDTFGHAVGDQLLQEVSRRLEAAVRREDTVARLGGDEFTILLEDLRWPEDAAVLARKLLAALAEPCRIAGHELRVTTSIGIGVHPRDGATAAELLAHADAAMYLAKGDGRDGYRFYTPELTAAALQRVRLESELRGAIERNELLVHYQPQVELSSGRPVGVEASVRWRHPRDGLIGPERFVPVAEDTGLIIDIGRFVLREACRQAREWIDAGMGLEAVTVRVSATQLRRSDFVATVEAVLRETGLPPGRLQLEVTDELIAAAAASGVDTLSALGRLGIRFAIADFGRGRTSLAVLGRLPVQRLKIDCCTVAEMQGDETAAAVARAVAAVADSVGLEVIADGVDTPAQAALLQANGCRYAEGALFGPPVAGAELRRHWDGATFVSSRAGPAPAGH